MPDDIVRTIADFNEFCYLARRSVHTEQTLSQLEDALARFYKHREVFRTTGVREDFSLPRQHSLDHYPRHIREFGAPNGLCSSITESKHIKAIKEPYRRSSRFEALGQMLLINQRLDKLSAARTDFEDRGMLQGSLFAATQAAHATFDSPSYDEDDNDVSEDIPAHSQANRHTTSQNDDEEMAVDPPNPQGLHQDLATTTSESDKDPDGYWSMVEGPRVQASIRLAQRRGKSIISSPQTQR